MTEQRIQSDKIEVFTNDKKIAQKIQSEFSCMVPGYQQSTKYRSGRWDGKKKFYSVQGINDPKGWLFKLNKSFIKRISEITDTPLDKPDYTRALDFLKTELNELPFKPYKHQMKMFLGAASVDSHLGISSVGSGKSLVIYLLMKYYHHMNKKILILVPTIDLVHQMKNDILDYSNNNTKLKIQQMGGEFTSKEVTEDILISTWQSADKSDLKSFDVVINDECLHPTSRISTACGRVEIQNLKEGDLVWTLDENNQKKLKPIIKVHKNLPQSKNKHLYVLKTPAGTLRLTGNHEVKTDKGWKRTDSLEVGDEVLGY